MRITHEWACQLAYGFIGTDIDFANINTIHAPKGIRTLFIPISRDVDVAIISSLDEFPLYETFEREEIELRKIGDRINKEYTYLGYGRETNTLAIGETYSA